MGGRDGGGGEGGYTVSELELIEKLDANRHNRLHSGLIGLPFTRLKTAFVHKPETVPKAAEESGMVQQREREKEVRRHPLPSARVENIDYSCTI